MSPQRRRSSGDASTAVGASTAIVTSPRRGFDSKRRRTDMLQAKLAITDFAGWGICSISEFARFNVGDQFVMIIPSDHKNDNKHGIAQRKSLRKRVVTAVATTLADNTPSSTRAPFRRNSDRARMEIAEQELLRNHGIERRQIIYIELRCSIHRYPHRDDYLSDILPVSEVARQIRQHEGIFITLLDYPAINATNVFHIRWSEVPFVQVWSKYYRGDYRPPITISSERGTAQFGNEFEKYFHQYKDDNLRLSELLLAYERKKNDKLTKTLQILERNNSIAMQATHHLSQDFIHNQMKEEMTDNRLPEFCTYADKIYHDAWIQQYSDFNPNTALLCNSAIIEMHQRLETTFPIHHASMKSIIYGKRSHEPGRALSNYNLEKRNVLVHYFFCFLRERDRHKLPHWALVATVALHYRGVDANSYRSGLGRAWSLELRTAMEMLDDIYHTTHQRRMDALKDQRFLMSALDNYNRFQRFSTQRCGKSGVFHNGIVFSAVRPKEFNKPRGTILRNNKSEVWKVQTSTLSADYRKCTVTAMLLQEWPNASDEHTPTGILSTITLPSNEWKIVSMPGSATSVTITHLFDQAIPSSLRQRVPINVDTCTMICDNRSWMATVDSDVQYRTMRVREYADNVKTARRIIELWSGIASPLFDASAADANEHFVSLRNSSQLFRKQFMDKVGDSVDSSILYSNIKRFQQHCLEFFNEAYHVVDEYIWLPLLAKDEMQKDELFLATIDILSQFGMIDTSSGKACVIMGSDFRRMFQFGDVLTVQKLHQLNPSVLRNMTQIGNEVSAQALHKMFTKNSIRSHDYLHENIHRLQAIFKIYYPGFIEICCRVIGAKCVNIDPTKGSWRDHEIMALKMASAIKHLRLHTFLKERSPVLSNADTPIDRLWKLQIEYSDYCQSLLCCPDEVTRYCALFVDAVDRWENCRDAVRMGDWATLEVEAIDWLPIWLVTKKPLYLMETMRRNEIIYSLEPEELEYLRMGRFVRMTRNGAFMSYDDFCEKHNYAMKQCSNHPDMEVMCRKSRHLHAASRCIKLMVGHSSGKHATIVTTNDDIQAMYKFFLRCGVFRTSEEARCLDDMAFSQHAIVESFENSVARNKIDRMVSPALSEIETILLSEFHQEEDSDAELEDNDQRNHNNDDDLILDDDDSVCSTSTTGGHNKSAEGISATSDINMLGVKNLFDFNDNSFQDAVRKRSSIVAEEKAWERIIEQSVQYFNAKLKMKTDVLKDRHKTRPERESRVESNHEVMVRQSRLTYIGV